MADYWKSNPRKYCEVCKCWMADNKISVQNHESGLRHKGNVEKKMNELQRNNKNAELEKQKLQENIQKINDSAFVGMMKDLARDPSLAKRYGVVLTDELQKQVSEQSNQPNIKRESKKSTEKSAAPKHPVCEWRESTAPDGRKYYWNVNTLATQWTRPEGVVAEEVVSVKEEKNRLQQFVFNRLVELSESGAEGATAAVCQAFNAASEPDEKGSSVASSGENEGFKNESLSKEAMKFEGPKMDLLGQWVPVEDVCSFLSQENCPLSKDS
ncbi:unnamed protein product [Calicophoron daubneyi]|uniref:WW domain-binding protein 4 n=1 Tax=Calicophoron daubneyi TaxID=300641 RepID=A0AAV2THF4_CALDB